MKRSKYWEYVDWIGPDSSMTRLEAAIHFGVRKETALYHLEVARSEGWLEREVVECDGNQTGYGYYWTQRARQAREQQLELEGFEVAA